MTPNQLVGYVDDAIRRMSDDVVSSQDGSHAAGIFIKAVSGFEKRMATFTASVTSGANLDKRTLGALIEILEKLPNAGSPPLQRIIAGAREVNDPWKRVKHGDDPPIAALLLGLRKIREVLGVFPS